MKILELFAGSRSIGKVAEQFGVKVFSVDIESFDGIDLVNDIEFLSPEDIPFKPDVIWASPPCTTYSIAGIRFHRNRDIPISEFAIKSDRVLKKTLELIRHFGCDYYIENPRGYLRKMYFMQNIPKCTIWYCQYGDNRAKPTDIWTNNLKSTLNPYGWTPRPECKNGNKDCHHDKCPRGTNNGLGTQGKLNSYERSIIPTQLCIEIVAASLTKHIESNR